MTLRLLPGTLWFVAAVALSLPACGDDPGAGSSGGDAGDGPTGGVSGTGPGGAAPTGGASGTASGGASGTGNGGTAGNASGGTSPGGSASTGGSNTGGAATGGANTGGATGGSSTGGAAGGMTGGSGGTAGTGTGGKAGSGTGGSAGSGSNCTGDTCAFASGVTWQCKKRFQFGINYAWQNFGGDFGGVGNQRGVAQNTSAINTKLTNWAGNGVNVIRWWVWPDFRGNGVTFNGTTPTGLGSTTLADLEAALTLAEQHDVYLMLTLFSFDGFKSNAMKANMSGFATDATRRAALVTNVIRPFARAAQASTHSKRLLAWDVINEPEWSVSGASLYGGDPAFDPQTNMQTVSHAQMETLLRDVIAGLRAESSALVTIGSAALKWKNAWSRLDQDFYQFHIYDWVQTGGWPYNRTPTQYGVAGKPVVMGEFPPAGLSGISYRTMLDYWYGNGYAGALAWQDSMYVVNFTNVKSFADAHACETQY